MPVPTAQPQRSRIGVGGLDAGVAHRLLGGGEREAMRAIRELEHLRGAVITRSSKPFTSAAMRVEKPDASNSVIGAAPLLHAVERRPRRRDVVADRRDEADAGDGDAPSRLHAACAASSSARARDERGRRVVAR